MKKLFTFLFFSSITVTIFAQGTWIKKADFGGIARRYAAGFCIDNKGYIGTGYNAGDRRDFWQYDYITNAWTQKSDFGGTARQLAVGFSVGGKGYIGLGNTGTKDIWEYDPNNNTWLQKTDFGGVWRNAAVAFSIGNKGYVGTGGTSTGGLNDFWEYDPSNDTWSQKQDFPGAGRAAATGFAIGNKGYIGLGDTNALPNARDFWEWDQANNSWSGITDFPGTANSYYYVGSFSVGNRGYVIDAVQPYAWDQASSTWIQTSSMPDGRDGAVSFTIGSKGYIGTGDGTLYKKDFWQFNPFSYSFIASTDSICLGSNVTFTNAPTDPEAHFYEWWFMTPNYSDTVFVTDTLSTALQYLYNTIPGMHHVRVNVSDSNGIYLGYSSIDVFVSAISSVSFAVAPAGCNSFDGTAAVSSSGGVAPYSYQWSTNSSMQTVSGLAAGNYSVTITDDIGCAATASVSVGTSSVVPTPTICMVTVDSISQNNVIMWDKTSYQHVDSFIVYREVGLNNYQPIASIPYDSMSLFVDTVRTKYFPNTGDPNAGTYKYKLQIRDSCGGLSPLSQDHNTIFIINSSGTFSWPQLYLVGGTTNPVNNYILMRDNASNGNWTVVNSVAGSQQTVTDPQYATYQATASWRVETQWSISCTPTKINPEVLGFNSSRSNIFSSLVTGVQDYYSNPLITISPNPFAETATLHIQNGGSMNYEFKMLDIYGREVMTHIIPKGMDDFRIERNGLASGMYFYKLANGNAIVASGKLIIE